jgi:hypothetical protein
LTPKPDCDVSVIIPFTDAEDRVGAASRRVADHLRALGLSFEVLAVDEDSGDNSVPLLALMRTTVPELRLLAAAPREGFAAGGRVARGRALWLIDVEHADAPLGSFTWAYGRVRDGAADAVVVPSRWLVCRRTRVWRAIEAVRGRGAVHERRFVRRARLGRLRIETSPVAAPRRAWTRLLAWASLG